MNHVAVVRVDGSTFKHFIKLFGGGAEAQRKFALVRKVSCILDTDPSRKENIPHARWKKCWPFEIDVSPIEFSYNAKSGVIVNLEKISKAENIGIFYNLSGKGKTFEDSYKPATSFNIKKVIY